MRRALTLLAALLLAPLDSLHAAGTTSDATLESRGLPRSLFNNDSDDLKWPAYPAHHASVGGPAGNPILLPAVRSPEDYLSITQTRDYRFQLLTSKNDDVFNLAWVKAPPTPPTKM